MVSHRCMQSWLLTFYDFICSCFFLVGVEVWLGLTRVQIEILPT